MTISIKYGFIKCTFLIIIIKIICYIRVNNNGLHISQHKNKVDRCTAHRFLPRFTSGHQICVYFRFRTSRNPDAMRCFSFTEELTASLFGALNWRKLCVLLMYGKWIYAVARMSYSMVRVLGKQKFVFVALASGIRTTTIIKTWLMCGWDVFGPITSTWSLMDPIETRKSQCVPWRATAFKSCSIGVFMLKV